MTPMVVQCSSCLTEFELDPRKLPSEGVRARCSVCSAVIVVPAPPAEQQEPQTQEERQEERQEEPKPTKEPQLQGEQSQVATAPAPSPQPAQAVAAAQGPSDSSAAQTEQPDEKEQKAPEPESAPSTQVATPEPAQERAQPEQSNAPAPVGELGASAASSTQAQNAPGAQRRPINPFLARDPALRAKRLARALVSDIVAYHPARHAEGLRDGTLKTLFRDEIKKSYEEYVDQVGRDFAGTTTHFQDALNDVLASGKKLF